MSLAVPADDAAAGARGSAVAAAVYVLAYGALEIALFLLHDPGHDEAQAWLWAKELAGWGFFVVPGEGHPPVWFWILRALSTALSFDQARLLTLGIAILNAVLLARLLGRNTLLLALILLNPAILAWWGFHFRPYPLVLTCVLAALLLDRAGRGTAAIWMLVLACGLHFFAGLFFALWLIVQLRRGTPLTQLLGPASVAGLFALSAILSAGGNADGALHTNDLPQRVLDMATRTFHATLPPVLTLAAALLLIGYGLRKVPVILASVLALGTAFAVGTALLYPGHAWHSAFPLVMLVMAWMLAGREARHWPLMLLLVPAALPGVGTAARDLRSPTFTESEAYAAVVADAGGRLRPEENLVAWPDFVLLATAARHDLRYIGGNNGAVTAPLDLRTRTHYQLDAEVFAEVPTPYWLICGICELPLQAVAAAGLQVTRIYTPGANPGDIPRDAYRIE